MNGKLYYSADNGFACAAASRGVSEALQEHLNVIVRNEELEIETNNADIQAEIAALVEDKERLEQQKLDHQDSIDKLTEQLEAKNVDLAELQTELNALDTNRLSSPDENMNTLRDIEEDIEKEIKALDDKKVERAGLETSLKAHVPTELNVDGTTPKKISIFNLIYAIFATFTILGMLAYLIFFYASAGEKSLIAADATADKIINAKAFSNAWTEKNWLIIFFPSVFVGFALMIHYFLIENILMENSVEKRWIKVIIGLFGLGFVLFLDFQIAEKISRDIYEFKEKQIGAQKAGEWVLWNSDLIRILLLGFVVTLFLSFVWYPVQQLWKGVRPLAKQIPSEDTSEKVQLVSLTTEIQQIENSIDRLKQKKENYEKEIKSAFKLPIDVKIARLEREKDGLQTKINQLNTQVESLQKEIDPCENKIEDLFHRQRASAVDLKKLEAQANEFISGWCRYVAQSKTDLVDNISEQIKDIQKLKEDTLETYKASLTIT